MNKSLQKQDAQNIRYDNDHAQYIKYVYLMCFKEDEKCEHCLDIIKTWAQLSQENMQSNRQVILFI